MGNELYLDFMRLSAAFNVGHIYTFPPDEMLDEAIKNGDRFFPLFIKKNSGKWEIMGIIDNALPENKIGNEVLKINGKEIEERIINVRKASRTSFPDFAALPNSAPFSRVRSNAGSFLIRSASTPPFSRAK
jgi:hypothetical protein